MDAGSIGTIQKQLQFLKSRTIEGLLLEPEHLLALIAVADGFARTEGMPSDVSKLLNLAREAQTEGRRRDCQEHLIDTMDKILRQMLSAAAGSPISGAVQQAVQAGSGGSNSILDQCKFETRDTPYGIEAQFIQPKGMTLGEIAQKINSEAQERFGWDAISPSAYQNDRRMRTSVAKDVVHVCIPVVKGSESMTRWQQAEYLRKNRMSFADKSSVLIAAGLYRLIKGLPEDLEETGLLKDSGDLLQAQVVRTSSMDLHSSLSGVGEFHFDDGVASNEVSASGVRTG